MQRTIKIFEDDKIIYEAHKRQNKGESRQVRHAEKRQFNGVNFQAGYQQ